MLEEGFAAQRPPSRGITDFETRKGFQYHTWFRAMGTFGNMEEMRGTDSPPILGEMEELEDFDVPAAFFSGAKLGKVKWPGIRSREELIEELNTTMLPANTDFRDVYPHWEYHYFIAESVGPVVVQTFDYRAKQPLNGRDRLNGFKPN